MAEPVRLCPACYRPNPWAASRCTGCGAALETDEPYDERLIWALDHPDSGIAVLAAQLLAERHARQAIDRLIELVDSADPYRAAAAARALTAFTDDERAVAAVEACRTHRSALVRRAVSRAEPGRRRAR